MDDLARRYVDDGYVVVPDLIGADELAELAADLARFAVGDYPIANPPSLPEGADADEAMRQVLAVHFPHWVSPVARRFVEHPGIVDVLTRIVGAHLPHWDGRVKCMQSMLFVKPPGYPGQAWHQDERFIPTRDRSLTGAWICLDDADEENGCLWVVPGSHRTGGLFPTRPHDRVGEFDGADEAHGFDESTAVAVPVRAGDVVFFNGYLLHRSFRNRSDRFRRALVNHYMNAWSLLPWGAVPADEGVATFDNRRVVPVVGEDPYASWRPLEAAPATTFLRPAGVDVAG